MIQIRLYCTFILLLTLNSCISTDGGKEKYSTENIEFLNYKETKSINKNGKIEVGINLPVFNQNYSFINSFINQRLYNILESDTDDIHNPKLNIDKIDALVNSYADRLAQSYSDIDDLPDSEFYTLLNLDTINIKKNFIIISEHEETFTGGAHGMYSDSYYHFDILKQKLLELNNLFDIEKLNKVGEKYFLQEKGLTKKSINLESEGYSFEENKFQLNNNYYFSDDKIIFTYNPYEIASYAEGQITIKIPKSELKNIIKKEYEYLIN